MWLSAVSTTTSLCLSFLVSRQSVLHRAALATASINMSTGQKDGESDLSGLTSFYQLVVDSQGTTSMIKRDFTKGEKKSYAASPQIVQTIDESFGRPTQVVFTRLKGNNPWHHCPMPQFVVTLSGSWWIETTDGKKTVFEIGDVLYQDNTEKHPAAEKDTNKAKHYSGTPENVACDQMIVQLDLKDGPMADSMNKASPF